ncbi:hypothetical protein [Clostridium sp. BJN0001]|uniref:hypothetical protein n=1 Tax=Clostridium sp. BJN0001 TaxID=2930219 RepID=UPI001FD272B8|nr:hypothetical protein [Clostridium sp. BJN0001]
MKYIGPFFRMNNLSQNEIKSQLFHLSKETVKSIVLNSKCGLLASFKNSKNSSIDDISILNNFSPLLCMYKKASPLFIHSKTSHGLDESSFKKDITPFSNALMTLSLLELSEYYSHYDSRNIPSFSKSYSYLAKKQLDFYSENLRNPEGLFVTKKNVSDANMKGFVLVDKNNDFKFSDQALMMDAYYLYYYYNNNDKNADEYKDFSLEILSMFKEYNYALYDLSFSENLINFMAFNIFYEYSLNEDCRELILDIGDFLMSKFYEKDYYMSSITDCSLFAVALMKAYQHTKINTFKDMSYDIEDKLISLYNSDKNIYLKLSDKKDFKFSCNEINSYLLSLIIYSDKSQREIELKPVISGIYRKFYVDSSLLNSWPAAPTIDEAERYKNLSLSSNDMLDETFFRMPNMQTPESSGLASVFIKNISYSRKKENFSVSKNTFDSEKNMLNFFLNIHFYKPSIKKIMGFNDNEIEFKKYISTNQSKKDEILSDIKPESKIISPRPSESLQIKNNHTKSKVKMHKAKHPAALKKRAKKNK